MKIVKTFRIDGEFAEKIKTLAEEQGITFSQFVELACYAMADEKAPSSKQVSSLKEKNQRLVRVPFMLGNRLFQTLLKITEKKGSTLSQEVRYRLSATLESPIFSDQEFSQLFQARDSLNRFGNLLKLALDSGQVVDEKMLSELDDKVSNFKKEWGNTLIKVRKRSL